MTRTFTTTVSEPIQPYHQDLLATMQWCTRSEPALAGRIFSSNIFFLTETHSKDMQSFPRGNLPEETCVPGTVSSVFPSCSTRGDLPTYDEYRIRLRRLGETGLHIDSLEESISLSKLFFCFFPRNQPYNRWCKRQRIDEGHHKNDPSGGPCSIKCNKAPNNQKDPP